MNYFDVFTTLGIDLINFAKNTFFDLVTTFISPLEEILPILNNTELGSYSIVSIMFGAGIPLYLVYVFLKFFADILT